ncbi:MAG: hypothetical protein CL557_12405 [Alphaproteobacteria bacterium]|nr:hypothetical protein [Alphaproteobacteria bacterium]|tara:strand:+ start:14633 stop:14899 length:267 start_codon:yes stop_codon:yes gene_type:complete
MNSKAKLRAVDDLMKSKGWQVLNQIMKDEIVSSAMSIADNASMDLQEINFRRGSIWAAKQMLEMPIRLRQKLEAEIALDTDDRQTTDD